MDISKTIIIIATAAVLFTGLCVADDQTVQAVCIVDGSTGVDGSPNITGSIIITQPEEGDVTIAVNLTGFGTAEAGKLHGFHIHEHGNMGHGCTDAGGHFNPFNRVHGGPTDPENIRHVGDLGNVMVAADGTVVKTMTDPLVRITGDESVVNLGFVIHAGEDDLGKGTEVDSNTTGHAGARWGCCIIETASPITDSSSSHVTSALISVIGAAITVLFI